MYQRDYFLKLAQQFARMMARLMGFKEAGEIEKAQEIIEEAYKEWSGLERNVLISIPVEKLISILVEERKIQEEKLEILAKFFWEDADLNKEKESPLLEKSLLLLEYLEEHQRMYSFEREELIVKIRERLRGING